MEELEDETCTDKRPQKASNYQHMKALQWALTLAQGKVEVHPPPHLPPSKRTGNASCRLHILLTAIPITRTSDHCTKDQPFHNTAVAVEANRADHTACSEQHAMHIMAYRLPVLAA